MESVIELAISASKLIFALPDFHIETEIKLEINGVGKLEINVRIH